ncbi:2-oxoacid ferredoxin oxidoreductase [Pseudomonas cichorii]|uniref:2-oxoacid ferredoxin oxidoreductase n=1 Tax=Pseudomonas cichorii TaxID=36746 RepID=UPI0021AACF96|nr:2-oxoacid ferredoxin oxidoreductase [Pseudomonas cichorii]
MKFPVSIIAAALLLAGCAAPSDSARSAGPTKVLSSSKQDAAVAQCIQVSWQNEAMFGTTSDVFLHKLSGGGFTVFTTEARYFADVRSTGPATEIEFYAPQGDSHSALRAAAIATCL